MIVKSVVTYFEEEGQNGADGVTYVKTLQELKKFKDARDPFTEEFYLLFQSVSRTKDLVRKYPCVPGAEA